MSFFRVRDLGSFESFISLLKKIKEMKSIARFTVPPHDSGSKVRENKRESPLNHHTGHTQGSALRHVPSCSGPTPDKHPYVGPRPERTVLLLIHNAPLCEAEREEKQDGR